LEIELLKERVRNSSTGVLLTHTHLNTMTHIHIRFQSEPGFPSAMS